MDLLINLSINVWIFCKFEVKDVKLMNFSIFEVENAKMYKFLNSLINLLINILIFYNFDECENLWICVILKLNM